MSYFCLLTDYKRSDNENIKQVRDLNPIYIIKT
jgi:hypothetical protein